jgi:hypothetical protein
MVLRGRIVFVVVRIILMLMVGRDVGRVVKGDRRVG